MLRVRTFSRAGKAMNLVFIQVKGISKRETANTPMETSKRLLKDKNAKVVDGSSFDLTAFSDADHTGCIDTRKSTSGGIQFLGDKLVSWMSKKQNCTLMSSAEAKYMALSASYAQVMWMRTQLQDYRFNYNKISLYCDSQSVIAISFNPVQQSRTKHIHTRYQFIKEQVENGIIELYFVRTKYQLADMFTKALPKDRIRRRCCSLIPAESNSSAHAHAQTTKTSANSDKQDLHLRYQVYQEPAEVEEVIKVVTATKLMTKVVTTAATIITDAQLPKASAPRRKRGVVIQDPEEIATALVIVHTEVKSKDKGKGILIKEPKPLKRQAQIEQDEAFARELEAELNANIKWDDVMEQKREKEIEEEGSKRKGNSLNQDAAKKQRIDEEEEEIKAHLEIIVNDDDDDDVFTEATPLASKVFVVDYQILYENNKPYYQIIKADGTHKLFMSFITLLKNFNREDLEMLWNLVQERFQSSEPKNFSDDFLQNTFKIMFEKPNVKASIWRDQKGGYGLAKVKSWKLFKSCGVHIITLTSTQMILLVEEKYPLKE
nr:Gag-Pol polyprotein [Tanacetum cinerariifolium]